MTTPTITKLTRRSLLGGALACVSLTPANAASKWRYAGPVEITAEDIAWFRACRSVWIDCESGAPAIVPGDMTLEAYGEELDNPTAKVFGRMERLVCAFFLHAAFTPGPIVFSHPVEDQDGFTVTPDHIRLLQTASWRTSAID